MIVLSLMISSVEEHDLKVCEPNLFLLFLSVSRYLPQWIAQDELSETERRIILLYYCWRPRLKCNPPSPT